MNKHIATAASLMSLLTAGLAFAQLSGGDFEITSSTIDGGGGVAAGGDYSLHGTIGQADAGTSVLAGGDFTLSGGFWTVGPDGELIFSDGFEQAIP
jgi:hypothetical protein